MDMRIMDIINCLTKEERLKDMQLINYIIKKYMDGPYLSRKSADIIPYLEVNDREDFVNIIYNINCR
jgi:hypothetical protein|tara:strand:- start:3517 stop:3717 length:201 start_codon:yes stop_codon:yes gene_type:complete